MIQLLFAAEEAAETGSHASEGLPLGLSLEAFIIQLVTFVLIFFLLKKFAFTPIVKLLNQRHKVIEDGVKLGQKMEKEQAKLQQTQEALIRDARHEGDKIIATAHKEAREVSREAEKAAQHKAGVILADAEVRIEEESERAKRALEKDIVSIVSEATEAIVGEKVDAKKDAAIIGKILKETVKETQQFGQPTAEVYGERTRGSKCGTDPKQLAREIAAYLLSENLTYELESLVRDVMEYRASKGSVEATIVSAHDIDERVEDDVRQILHEEYPAAKQMHISTRLEPETVGGVRVELPNEQLDLTVRSKLNTFKRLTAAGKE